MNELDRVRERVRQSRTERLAAIGRYAGSPASAEQQLGMRFRPGARVFDRVTGQEGEVVGGTIENIVVAAPERQDG